jgi:hypothetical protein
MKWADVLKAVEAILILRKATPCLTEEFGAIFSFMSYRGIWCHIFFRILPRNLVPYFLSYLTEEFGAIFSFVSYRGLWCHIFFVSYRGIWCHIFFRVLSRNLVPYFLSGKMSERRVGNDAEESCLGTFRGITQSLSAVTEKTTEIHCKE